MGAGTVSALQAAGATLVLALVPAVAAWVAATNTDLPWTSAVRAALQAWLLSHHAALVIEGGSLSLVPLGLAALNVISCWFAGRRLAGAVDPRLERVMAGRASPSVPPARALVAFAATYTTVAFVSALLAATPAVRPIPGQAVLGAGAISTVGVCLGAATYVTGGLRGGLRLTAEVLQVPHRVRAWVAGAAAAVGVQLLAGAVVLFVGLLRGRATGMAVQRALDPGAVGSFALSALHVAYLPDGVIWGAAFVTGPGFSVGTDTFVTPAASSLGTLPAIPALAALPPSGSRPPALMAVLACGFLAGAIGGLVAARARRRQGRAAALLPSVADALGLGVVAGTSMLAVMWLAVGSIGPGRLADTGPQPLTVGLVFAGQVAAGALIGAVTAAARRRVRGRPADVAQASSTDGVGGRDAGERVVAAASPKDGSGT